VFFPVFPSIWAADTPPTALFYIVSLPLFTLRQPSSDPVFPSPHHPGPKAIHVSYRYLCCCCFYPNELSLSMFRDFAGSFPPPPPPGRIFFLLSVFQPRPHPTPPLRWEADSFVARLTAACPLLCPPRSRYSPSFPPTGPPRPPWTSRDCLLGVSSPCDLSIF